MATQGRAQLNRQSSERHEPPTSAAPRSPEASGPLAVLQRKAGNRAVQRLLGRSDAAAAAKIDFNGTGSGRPMPEGVRQKMESYFATDFSDVRVHVGEQAPSIGAAAFAIGSEIHFAPEHYNPETSQGQRILGHELAHVVQQRNGRVQNPFGGGVAVVEDPGLEAEADRLGARAAVHTMTVRPVSSASAAPIQAQMQIGSRTSVCQRVRLLGQYIDLATGSAFLIANYLEASWRPIQKRFRTTIHHREAQYLLLNRDDVRQLVNDDLWLGLSYIDDLDHLCPPLDPGIVRNTQPYPIPDWGSVTRMPAADSHTVAAASSSSASSSMTVSQVSANASNQERDATRISAQRKFTPRNQMSSRPPAAVSNPKPKNPQCEEPIGNWQHWNFYYHRHIRSEPDGYHIKIDDGRAIEDLPPGVVRNSFGFKIGMHGTPMADAWSIKRALKVKPDEAEAIHKAILTFARPMNQIRITEFPD